MSQKSALAKWQASNGDATGSKQDSGGGGTVRSVPTPPYGSDSQKKSYGAKASDPSMGGTFHEGKEAASANCDDALGTPGSHHGSVPTNPEVKSGRGPAAAKKQIGEIDAKYPASSAGYN